MAINQSNLPQFIGKLYSILNDPRYRNYIRWSQDGKSFIIIDSAEFSNGVLAEHFKHSNMSSFVRQLNKYDFHKVKSDDSSKMKYGSGMREFAHKNFRKDRLDLIGLISRKIGVPERPGASEHTEHSVAEPTQNYGSVFNSYIVNSMATITKYFEMISDDMGALKKLVKEAGADAMEKAALRVLIAEDNAACAAYASSIFKRSNFVTVAAETISELNFLLANTAFELVLMSSCVPDAAEIVKSIRRKHQGTLIIMTVEKTARLEGEPAKYQDADEVLYKPYPHEELVNIIKRLQHKIKTRIVDEGRRCKKRAYP